ncbi:hypothetical protein [Shewanella atlantica]|uniref:Uncharacterized protein n=1 Tax=Shewanella atlantica TaxID=271099 RepID=A0A431WBB2_9GAMM|nr:hypothetical protein [Shewanella atlantica]RTR32578.1 hypothetical protein EKG39_09355 [Shewanella atlantica]
MPIRRALLCKKKRQRSWRQLAHAVSVVLAIQPTKLASVNSRSEYRLGSYSLRSWRLLTHEVSVVLAHTASKAGVS